MAGFPIPNLSFSGGGAGGGLAEGSNVGIGANTFGGSGISIWGVVTVAIVVAGAVMIFKNRK